MAPTQKWQPEIIEEPSDTLSSSEKPSAETINTVLLALKTLPQKTALALSNCFALITVASVFWLAMMVINNPSVLQLIGLGGYAVFVLTINWVVRRK